MPSPQAEYDRRSAPASTRWWQRLVSIFDGSPDAIETLRSRMLVLSLVIVAVCQALIILSELLWAQSNVWTVVLAMLVLLLAVAFDYIRSGRYELYSHILVGGVVSLLIMLIVLTGGHSRGALVCFPSVVALAAVLLPSRALLGWSSVMLAGVALSAFLRANDAPVYLPLNPQWLESAVERMAAVLVVITALLGTCSAVLVSRLFDQFSRESTTLADLSARCERAEQRLEHYVELSSAWFWETDEQHRLVYLSTGFERSTGVNPKFALGLTPAQVLHLRYPNSPGADGPMRPLLERRGFKDQLLSWHEPLTGMINQYANSGTPIHDASGAFRGFRGRVVSVSERNETLRQMRENVHGDFLTGLMSRRGMLEAIDRALMRVRDSDMIGWWMQIDIDRFHEVNERLNYVQGDAFLKRFARALTEMSVRAEALARMDGDGFGALLMGVSREQVRDAALHILGVSRGLRMEFLGTDAEGSVSIGVGRISSATAGVGAILRAADEACTEAQRGGGARVVFAP
jgi:diguanylate cyclase (GGDEF)-like protein